jgi:hypothetical protein
MGLAVSVLLAYFLVRLSRGRLQLGRLFQLHRDEAGGVQSLSFVLTLPIFVMLMMLIVQISQIMIGIIVVQYAAFAAARSAIVWIPADLSRFDSNEGSNCISSYYPDPEAQNVFPIIPHQGEPILGHIVENYSETGPIADGVTYLINPNPNSAKYEKIRSAAVLACMGISPSREVGYTLANSPPLLGANSPPSGTPAVEAGAILQRAYLAISPNSTAVPAVPGRLRNKLAYALNNTAVEIRFYHQNAEPPLKNDLDGWHGPYVEPIPTEFAYNELGREDLVTVTVNYNMALLPGPGRLLASPSSPQINLPDNPNVSVHRISASAALNVEGEKAVIPYVY